MQAQKVLIIDDDDRNIFALKAVLKSKQFDCMAAADGLEALDILKTHTDISVALVDMMMPGMDGYELMALIRKMHSLNSVKLVAVTAQAMTGDKEKCLAAGADAYLSKPVDVDMLLQILSANHTPQGARQ
jgi:two-component system, cell cycle response regulator DivK